jgi:peptidoglycan-associated lipoprotein
MKFKGMLFASFLLLACLVVLWGCPKKAEMTAAPEASRETSAEADAKAAEAQKAAEAAAAARAAEEARLAEEAQARERAATASAGLKPIYFDYDKSNVRPDAAQIMRANADWLKAHPGARIRIEGNCDERGTREYNQALGQRRSASAKKYLTDMGVSAERITLLSYGKEKPVCAGNDEPCMQQNRRDDFIVMTK